MLNQLFSHSANPLGRTIAQALPALLASVVLALSSWFGWPASAEAAPLSSAVVMTIFHFSGTRPPNLGVQSGKLAACPGTPNCVNSQSRDGASAIAPLGFEGSPEAAFDKLKALVAAQPRTQIVQSDDTYLYAEFTIPVMGFVDDVEFYLDREAGQIHVRSASRLGESDLGVNRNRIEAIRRLWPG